MRALKRILEIAFALVVVTAAVTGVYARVREGRVLRVRVGMHRNEVERLVGAGAPDVSGGTCEQCPPQRKQLWYRANPSLWYGRFEDTLVVGYVDDVVCGMTRMGL